MSGDLHRAAGHPFSQNLVYGDALTMRSHDGQPITFYEDASLRYTGIESHQGLSHCELYDTVVARVAQRKHAMASRKSPRKTSTSPGAPMSPTGICRA